MTPDGAGSDMDTTLARFVALARARLRPQPDSGTGVEAAPIVHGDHVLDGLEVATPRSEAAVLIPVIAHKQEPTVLFTQRATTLRNHSGQISFPGGRVDAGDRDPLDTALRETWEEVGLRSQAVTLLGYLDAYITGTGYRITPVVALVEPGEPLHLNADEVDGIFECPLAFLMDGGNIRTEEGIWRGARRHTYVINWREHRIWGATAGIVRQLHDRLGAVS